MRVLQPNQQEEGDGIQSTEEDFEVGMVLRSYISPVSGSLVHVVDLRGGRFRDVPFGELARCNTNTISGAL